MRALLALAALALALPALPALADEPIPWDEADKHVGEEATVEGRVVDVHCSPLSCLLAFEPSFNRFTAVVQARNFDTFPPDDLERRYRGRQVLVHGTIAERDGKPEIVLQSPDDIALAGRPAGEPRRGEPSAAGAQADVMDRLATVLDRIDALTERMAAVQERLETLLSDLEQRQAALAAAQAAQTAASAPVPVAPRPAWEALRTVKRGMSQADVQQLVGPPAYVDQGGNGWAVWHYPSGGSVSFDGRGRVQGLSGVLP
jgi:hypothetical protein